MASDGTARPVAMPSATVRVHVDGSVGVVRIDHPPVNALSHSVRCELLEAILSLSAAETISSIVILGHGSTFPAGADIREFGMPIAAPTINEVNQAIESCPKPVIAAMHGTALGGGLEVAMACHYRVAVASASLGLPEVRLGVIPGAGGTQRLPRLIGSARAVSAIAKSEVFAAAEARELGLVDEIVDGTLETGAIAFARHVIASRRPPRLVRHMQEKLEPLGTAAIAELLNGLSPALKQSLAVRKTIESVQNASVLQFDEALRKERECVEQCKISPQAAALQHLFFAERAASRFDGEAPSTKPSPIARIGMVGSGPLRLDLAAMLVTAGVPVVLIERDHTVLDSVIASITARVERRRASATRSSSQSDASIDELLCGALDRNALKDVQIAIEVEPDVPELKAAAIAELGGYLVDHAFLITTTAFASVSQIAVASGRPGQVIGMHFFIPAGVMRLVEVVQAKCSGNAVTSIAINLARRLGKVPVVVRDGAGFIGDRTLKAYLNEAIALTGEGVPVARIDGAMREFGMAKGPFEVCRLVGLDLAEAILNGQRSPANARDARSSRAVLERVLVSPEPDTAAFGNTSTVENQVIVRRCLRAVAEEGHRVLAEGIAARSSDIDVVWVNGLGFPPHCGGPMFWSQREPGP